MTPEWRHALNLAAKHLEAARQVATIDLAEIAGREAYLACFHAALAFVHSRTGRVVKTHSGLRSEFARLSHHDPQIDPAFPIFLAQSFDIKMLADYDKPIGRPFTIDQAMTTIATAERMVACIEALLSELPPSQ